MRINRQLINLVGALATVIVLAAGIFLVAVPLYAQSQVTEQRITSVAQTNDVFDVQVQQLTAADARVAEIDADLAELRTEIPAIAQLDDVFELIDAATAATDSSIESVKSSDPEAWLERPAAVDSTGSGLPTPVETVAETESAGADGTPADAGDVGAEDTAEEQPGTDAGEEQPVADGAEVPPQRQVLVTIEVAVPDAAAAAEFVDVMRSGTRLVLPVSAGLEEGVLTLAVMAFVRMEETP